MRDLRGVISVCSSLLGNCSGMHQFNQFVSVSVLNAHSWWCCKTFPVAEINCIITRGLATFFEMVHLKTELKKYQNPQSRTCITLNTWILLEQVTSETGATLYFVCLDYTHKSGLVTWLLWVLFLLMLIGCQYTAEGLDNDERVFGLSEIQVAELLGSSKACFLACL